MLLGANESKIKMVLAIELDIIYRMCVTFKPYLENGPVTTNNIPVSSNFVDDKIADCIRKSNLFLESCD